jgi:hypothetical protein
MDRLARLRDLVEQTLDDLSRPTTLTHEQYAIVDTLHQVWLELEELRQDRLRLMARLGEKRP